MSFLDELDDKINKASSTLNSAYNTANNTLNTTSKALNWNKNNKSFKDSLEYKMIVKKTNRLQKASSVLQIIFLLLCIAGFFSSRAFESLA